MQVPIDFPAVASLVVFSSLIGRQVRIRPRQEDDWEVVPNLWGAIIGRSGLMKTPALNEALRFSRNLEGGAKSSYDEKIKDYERQKDQAEVDRAIAKKGYRDARSRSVPPRLNTFSKRSRREGSTFNIRHRNRASLANRLHISSATVTSAVDF